MSRYEPDQWVMLNQASVCIASGPHNSLRDGSSPHYLVKTPGGSYAFVAEDELAPQPPVKGDRGVVSSRFGATAWTVYMIDHTYVVIESTEGIAAVWRRQMFDDAWRPLS